MYGLTMQLTGSSHAKQKLNKSLRKTLHSAFVCGVYVLMCNSFASVMLLNDSLKMHYAKCKL